MRKNKTIRKRVHFGDNDFASNDGMLTSIWGPAAWHLLHTMSFNYPVNPSQVDKKRYMEFVLNMQYILPCGKCRENLAYNFKQLPLEMSHMESRDTFSRYIYDLHEVVNKMLFKVSNLSYENVRDTYEHFRARCLEKNKVGGTKTRKKHDGCVVPFRGKKTKCILRIVSASKKCKTFSKG